MIVITGASDGLGLELAKLYNKGGKTVVNVSRRECSVADYDLLHDLSKGSEIKEAVKEIEAIDEPLEVIVNNAGVYGQEKFGEITEEEIERLLGTNVKPGMLLTSGLIERIKRDGTDILNVISTAGTKGNPNHPTYAASKWAQRGYTHALQAELKGAKSRVISFCPGGMNTGMFAKNPSKDPSEDTSSYMNPAEVAAFAKQILDLPKSIEISEVIVNRK